MNKIILLLLLFQFKPLKFQQKLYHYGLLGEEILEIINTGTEPCDFKFVHHSSLTSKTESLPSSCKTVDDGLAFFFEDEFLDRQTKMGKFSTIYRDTHFGTGLHGQRGDLDLRFALADSYSSFYVTWPSKNLEPTFFYATEQLPAFKTLGQLSKAWVQAKQPTELDFIIENFYLEDQDKISLHIKGFIHFQTMRGELELEFSGAFEGKNKISFRPL